MAKKFSPEERLQYVNDKLIQLEVNPLDLAKTCSLPINEVNQYLVGTIEIDNKAWIQLGIGLGKLGKIKGLPSAKEMEKKPENIRTKSQTSIIRQVDNLGFFDGE